MQPRQAREERLGHVAPTRATASRALASARGRVARARAHHRIRPQRPHRELVVAGQHRGVGRGLRDRDRLRDPALHEQRVRLEHEQAGDERALAGRSAPGAARGARTRARRRSARARMRPARGSRRRRCARPAPRPTARRSRLDLASSARASARRFRDALARLQSAAAQLANSCSPAPRARPHTSRRPRASGRTRRASSDRCASSSVRHSAPGLSGGSDASVSLHQRARLERTTAHPLGERDPRHQPGALLGRSRAASRRSPRPARPAPRRRRRRRSARSPPR